MATEKVVVDVEVKAQPAVASVKSLKAELRQVTNELQNLEEGSDAFINAAKKAGALKDRIGDTKATIDAFNPEKKFQALAGAVGIAANGFSALQGAMALMGTENEELNKTIAKTQGAIALATGLNGLLGMGDAFKNLKNVAGDALKGIKAGIGATGIGLFVLAAGLILSNWDAISKAIKTSFPIFNDMGKIFDKLREVAYGAGEVIKSAILMPFRAFGKLIQGDFKGALEEIKNGYNIVGNYKKGAEAGIKANEEAAAAERLKKLIEQREKELEVNKASGKDTYKQELALNKLKQEAAKENKDELEKLRQDERVLIAAHNKVLSDKAKAKAKEDKKIADDKKAYDLSFAEMVEAQRLKNVEEEKKIADINTFNAELDLKNAEEAAKKKIEIEKSIYEAKKQIQEATLSSAQSVISILQSVDGESKEIQAAALIGESAIGIAKMIIANNAANIAALATPQAIATSGVSAIPVIAMNNISTALGVAANIAATAKGLSALGKSGAPSGTIAPTAPRIPQSISGTKLGGNSQVTTTGDSTVGKVIVVETDITNTQNKVKGIIRKATIK